MHPINISFPENDLNAFETGRINAFETRKRIHNTNKRNSRKYSMHDKILSTYIMRHLNEAMNRVEVLKSQLANLMHCGFDY